jgi:hypothetical protein
VRLQPLRLTVRVTDADGRPVDDVPVHFRLPPTWAALAELVPPTAVTRHGQAAATFRARAAGQLTVEITVAEQTEMVHIAVLGEVPRF